MNILILTPDSVGSTILQRLITIGLNIEKVPVTNTHELVNGLELKNGVATKNFDLEYTQTLKQITDVLNKSSKDTQLVSRFAKYHIDARNDNLAEKKKFFSFLDRFYQKKIMCVRENIFEYAMSWSIRNESGVLNVCQKQDRKKVLQVSKVNEKYFIKKCQEYVDYQYWMEKYFTNVEKVSYEDMITNTDVLIEQLIGYKDTFKKKFGMPLSIILRNEYKFFNSLTSKNDIQILTKKEQRALYLYKQTGTSLIKQGIILDQPIKNTTLYDKRKQIKNFKQCLDKFYSFAKNHNWINQSKATYDFWNKRNIC
tara:strand:+ start:201 stop:1133 length:933 start_codon:yes stop_codon:yes gene_type:complete